MNIALQITSLQRIFTSLNPDIPLDTIDWTMQVDKTLTLPENRLNLSIIYPQHLWFADETEMKSTKQQALDDLRDMLDYMLSIVPEPAQADFREVFDDYISRATYSLERKLKLAPLKRKIADLQARLEDAKTTNGLIPQPPKAPPPLRWTKDLERKLRDTFEVTFTRAGLSPRRYMPEYRLELPVIKTLTKQDDMIKAVESLARELVEEEKARKFKPPRAKPPTEPRPPAERIIGLPPKDEDEEPFFAVPPVELPAYPEKPFKTALYPNRLLTATEIDDIWDAFRMAITMCGKNPDHYTKDFKESLETYLFTNWEQVKTNYANLIESICQEKKIAIIPRAPPAEVIDELVHWITSVNTIEDIIDTKTIKRKPETIEEVIDKLAEMGKMGVPRSDVIAAIKRGWKDKAPNYIIITKEYLEQLIGEPIE